MSMTVPTHASSSHGSTARDSAAYGNGALLRGFPRPEHQAMHLVPADRPAAERSTAVTREAVICSFHTPDDYYARHARELRGQLEALGLAHQLLEVDRADGADWADVTRRKIGFIRDACQQYPEAMVFWIDVDCRITHLPDYVRDSTADLIGFQRSFRTPLQIGYQNRARFWEPSFWGVNATAQGRKLVDDAFALEQRSDLRATDDYFLEEAWRANAAHLSFQMIPSTAVVRRSTGSGPASPEAFFVFGSSGNVAHFKDKVAQHPTQPASTSSRKKALRQAKKLEKALPEAARRPMRRIVDTLGVTGALTGDSQKGLDPDRAGTLNTILGAGMGGDRHEFDRARRHFDNRYLATERDQVNIEVAEAFLEHSARGSDQTIRLGWWSKPFPGNFGDWLSPLAVGHYSEANLRLQPVTKATNKPHLIALGSIGRFIRPSAIVVGTGISRDDIELARTAQYISVRGPITAGALRTSGGPKITEFGDPGVLVSRLLPIERGSTNGRIALVRHHSHRNAPIDLPDHIDELSVLMSRTADIEAFLRTLASYDAVITSAMHVMTACQSYAIPCGLVTFDGFEDRVHGSGIKYADYALGAGVEVVNPQVVGLDLRRWGDLGGIVRDIRVSDEVKDRVERHMRVAVAHVLDAGRTQGKKAAGNRATASKPAKTSKPSKPGKAKR
ncbi:MAG: polysaccharide pyruvyl transferase family protein [Candidatus Nanopelagicales bacterium]